MAKSSGATAQPQQQVRPGELFGLPSFTRWTEQFDVNNALTAVPAQSATTPQTGYLPFRTTDIVFCWMWSLVLTQGTISSTTTTVSRYFPWNWVQQFQIAITNLYDVIDVQSGVDLAIFNTIRPFRSPVGVINPEYNQVGSWPNANSFSPSAAELNFQNFASSASQSTASIQLDFEVPMCQFFDEYFELDRDGHPLAVANRVPVSPLYMSGTARNVFPVTTFAAGSVSNLDTGPFNLNGSVSFSGQSFAHTWKRVGIYGTTNKLEMPPVFNWRYALVSRRVALGAVSQVDIPLKNVVNNGGGGQVLSMFVRFWDPAANSGLGQPISFNTAFSATTIKEGKLIYGSGLIRYDDLPKENQQRFIQQHNIILPQGVWVWDLATDENQRFTNARALNLYTTDVFIHFDFTGALSSSAYCVVGVEYLTYVLDQPVLV